MGASENLQPWWNISPITHHSIDQQNFENMTTFERILRIVCVCVLGDEAVDGGAFAFWYQTLPTCIWIWFPVLKGLRNKGRRWMQTLEEIWGDVAEVWTHRRQQKKEMGWNKWWDVKLREFLVILTYPMSYCWTLVWGAHSVHFFKETLEVKQDFHISIKVKLTFTLHINLLNCVWSLILSNISFAMSWLF